MKVTNIILGAILFIPIIGVLLYIAINPEDTALWGNRWRLKNENCKPSDEAVKYTRITSIIMIVVGIIILIAALK